MIIFEANLIRNGCILWLILTGKVFSEAMPMPILKVWKKKCFFISFLAKFEYNVYRKISINTNSNEITSLIVSCFR